MQNWFPFAAAAMIMWGLWGFFPKLATNHIDPKSVLIYEVLGTVIIGFIVFAQIGFKPQIHTKGMTFAVLAGVANILGILFFLYAISRGKTSTVVTTTALYPIVTITLAAIILREPITAKQGIGILFAVTSIVLISS